ncbi:MAG: hypothetical protein LRZ97_01630, partial [Candidatus Pacebacteria bacterium]|nr:hypothetical protein [Candidatus Paceibacterota bacterium]
EYSSFGTRGERVGSVCIKNMIKDGKFVIRCKDEDGDEIGRNSCDIQVNAELYDGTSDSNNNQPKANITANETQVTDGDIVTIAWRGDNTDNCTITGPDGFREYGNKGSVTGRILQTSTFQLSCISSGVLLPIEEITIVAN